MKFFPFAALLLLVATLVPSSASAQDSVLLSEVLPVLEGTALGTLEVAPAPPPGSSRTIRRSEVLVALRDAGRDASGLVIPRRVVIHRGARELSEDELREIVEPSLATALAPCRIEDISLPSRVTLAMGEVTVETHVTAPRRSGNVSGVLTLRVGSRQRSVSVRARVNCPEPAIHPGARVRIVAVVGNVRASAPGEARQVGRVGDIIRVRNGITRNSIRARIIDANTVEIVR
jgi:hypothetical protein